MLNAFETPRLLFRPFTLADLNDLHQLYASPEIMRYITTPRTLAETETRLQKHIADRERYGFGLFAAILKKDGAFVGRCGLDPAEIDGQLQGDIAWMFAPAYWGRGFATEFGHKMIEVGFTDLGLPRIFATAHPENIASIKVMEKLHMHYVGCRNKKVLYEVFRPQQMR